VGPSNQIAGLGGRSTTEICGWKIELVLTASKKAIPGSIGALRNHEIVMTNFLELYKCATFSPEGSAHDKHLKTWIENMQKVGSEAFFPNSTTAANVNEVTRTLLRNRRTTGVPLESSVVWDQVRAALRREQEPRMLMLPSNY
jgi:hypothetical protein